MFECVDVVAIERRRNVLVLEDGIPAAAAPYVSSGMYYATPIYGWSGMGGVLGGFGVRSMLPS